MPTITEFLALNRTGLKDQDGDTSDWIEITNESPTESAPLKGWYLTDDNTNLRKWRFPDDVTLNPNSRLIVFASGKNRTDPTQELHTNFRLDGDGEYLGLAKLNDDGVTVTVQQEFAPQYPPQFEDISYGLAIGSGEKRFFNEPTPGEPNQLPAAPKPQVVASEIFFGETTVELKLDSPNATNLEIRYTLDGSDPDATSTLYSGPFTLSQSAMLQARSFDTSQPATFSPSHPATGTFFALSEDLRDRTSDRPIIILDILEKRLPATSATNLQGVNVLIIKPDPVTGRTSIANPNIDYLGRGGLRDRGSTSASQPKPNMTFETWGPTGSTQTDQENVPILGMDAHADWIFYASTSYDPTIIHNQFAFDLSNQIGQWAPDYRQVEVFFNRRDGVIAANDYHGAYAIHEAPDHGAGRIPVASIDPTVTATPEENPKGPNISGGYIWKIDRSDPSEPGFSGGGQSMNWVYPKSPGARRFPEDKRATREQQAWVQSYFNDFARTLRTPDINDPEGYSKYIDVDSWVEHHLLNILMFNVDALRLSAYFYKDRNEKIVYGPVFDFDRALGSTDGRDSNPFVWRAQTGDLGTDFFGNGTQRWWGDLFRDPGFWQAYVDKWWELRQREFSDDNLVATVDRIAGEIRESQSRVSECSVCRHIRPRGTWEDEIERLKKFLLDRASFIDANFTRPPIFFIGGQPLDPRVQGQQVTGGTGVTVIPRDASKLFNDTPFISGEPGAATGRYLVPTDDSLGKSWTELAFDDSSWSSGALGFGFENTTSRFDPFIKTRIKPTEVSPDAVGLYTRIKFQVADIQAIKELVLKLRYDDGFIAYINGVEVARRNSRDANPTFSTRGSSRRDTDAINVEDIRINDFQNVLRPGDNVLAIHVLNTSTSDSNMLLLPELASRVPNIEPSPTGTIYYTLDGSDPRGPDGQPSGQARILAAGETLTITRNTRVVARDLDPAPREPVSQSRIVRTDWSGPITFDFIVQPQSNLVVSEINYNPSPPAVEELKAMPSAENEDFEFLEIRNVGSTTQDLVGVKLTDGVEFDFTTGAIQSLAPGGYAVVVRNRDAFQLRYGSQIPLAGQYTGNLNNAGEDIDLRNGLDSILFSVNYRDRDPWSVRADGVGATLELINHFGTPKEQQSKYYSWQGSFVAGGTPGADNSRGTGVVINEVVSNPSRNGVDAIELYNTSDVPVAIGGWFLSDTADRFLFSTRLESVANLDTNQIPDALKQAFQRGDRTLSQQAQLEVVAAGQTWQIVDGNVKYLVEKDPEVLNAAGLNVFADNLFKFQIAAGTVLGAKQYRFFTESDFNREGNPNAFALSGSRGDNVWLVTRNAAGGVGQFVDDVHFEAAFPGESFGRAPNGLGRLAPMLRTTLGEANAAPRVGLLVITEINYDPGAPSGAAKLIYPPITPSDLEFVEIHNPTTSVVNLERWKLRGGVDFDFDPIALGSPFPLDPGKTLIVVKFNPARPDNAARLAAFRAHYGIDESVTIVGGYQGQLNNADDRVSLRRPGTPPNDEPNLYPSLIEDEVLYDDQAPWPTEADSTGRSIHRRDVSLYGNDGTSWIAANPTPGSPGFSITTDGDFNGDGSVDIADINLMWPQLRSPTPDARFDLTGDARVNAADRDRLILQILDTTYGDSNLDGRFDTGDLVAVFQRGQYEDKIPLNSTWAEGDWDGNGDFDTGDLVLAFRTGGYELAQAVAAANRAADSGQRSRLGGAVAGAPVRTNVAGEGVLPRDQRQADELPTRPIPPRPLGDLVERDQIFRDTDRWLVTSLRGLVGRPGAGSFNREPEEAAAKQLSTRVRFP